jgi:hypothetical protein
MLASRLYDNREVETLKNHASSDPLMPTGGIEKTEANLTVPPSSNLRSSLEIRHQLRRVVTPVRVLPSYC